MSINHENKGGFPLHDTALLYHLNHKARISINTPVGETADFMVYNVVKQGTISGPLMCCSEVDQFNKIKEIVTVPYGPEVVLGMPEYVDDIATAGRSEDVEKGIRNCREMEKYKFSYGLNKTKYMIVMKTGTEPQDEIIGNVKEGKVQKTDEYQYVGLWVNEKGNLSRHLTFIREKMQSGVREMLSMTHESQVGSEAIRVRLKLYESTILQSISHRLEVWEGLTEREIKEFFSILFQMGI